MKNNKKIFFLISFIFIIFSSVFVFAQELPLGIQKIMNYNVHQISNFTLKISFFIAFVAGMLGILSPCILPFLPAYFSYTFKEKKNITKMTLVFFLGFSSVFVTMGAIAGFIGQQSLVVIQRSWLVTIAGIFLIILGIMSFFGKGFSSFIKFNRRFSNDVPGIFLFGIAFAFGWTACLGPILSGILGIGAVLHNILYSSLLLFFYSLGNLVPLFILSVFYDRFNLSKNSLIKGKMFVFYIDEKKYELHSTNIISGTLFLIIGVFLLIYKNTAVVNSFDIFGTKSYFYSLQNKLIEWQYANILGILTFTLFIVAIGWVLLRYKRKS